MNIKYMALVSEGKAEREANIEIMKKEIPELIVIPSNIDNVFENHVKAFDLEPEYDALLMLEDDVKLCKNFKTRLHEKLQGHENEVVSFFESPLSKKELHSEYRQGRRFMCLPCNYYPKEVCELLAGEKMMPKFREYFFTKLHEPWNYPMDRYIPFVLDYYGINYYMSVPFLVQHLTLKSNFKGRPRNRQTKYFIDDIEAEAKADT